MALVRLAQVTSLVTLGVFAMVNLSLYAIGKKMPETGLTRWRWLGLVGAVLATGLAGWQITHGLFS